MWRMAYPGCSPCVSKWHKYDILWSVIILRLPLNYIDLLLYTKHWIISPMYSACSYIVKLCHVMTFLGVLGGLYIIIWTCQNRGKLCDHSPSNHLEGQSPTFHKPIPPPSPCPSTICHLLLIKILFLIKWVSSNETDIICNREVRELEGLDYQIEVGWNWMWSKVHGHI